MSLLAQLNTNPNKLYRFDNYYSSQREVKLFIEAIRQRKPDRYNISGQPGFGVTHLLNAACNELKDHCKVIYLTAPWLVQLVKLVKKSGEQERLLNELLSYDVIAIDNTQYLYRRSIHYQKLIFQLLKECRYNNKWLVLGNSEAGKDLTRSKGNKKEIKLKQIGLKQLSSLDVFKGLKSLCSMEDNLPDNLLYAISGYNGPFKMHVNCLIAIRFKSRLQGEDLREWTQEELIRRFEIGSYFHKQQFRKCFRQMEMDFMEQFKFNFIRKSEYFVDHCWKQL